jgi:hypothetical protein
LCSVTIIVTNCLSFNRWGEALFGKSNITDVKDIKVEGGGEYLWIEVCVRLDTFTALSPVMILEKGCMVYRMLYIYRVDNSDVIEPAYLLALAQAPKMSQKKVMAKATKASIPQNMLTL